MSKTVSIISLGCFRNTYDSEFILKEFIDRGYVFLQGGDKINTLIINTCGFIRQAKEESLEYITKAVSLKKGGKIKKLIVAGCLVKRYEDELKDSFPDVDEWRTLVPVNATARGERKIMPRHIGFLKICEGCSNNCSYCSIPLIKGRLISREPEGLIEETKLLDKQGIKELNIIGQDVTAWGKDLKLNYNLAGLLKKILKETKNIRWLRILYTHPGHFNDELLDLIANEKRICKYVDLPIQHINDKILKEMNRKITKAEIVSLISRIRKKMPKAVLRTSLIVGFPGETEKQFKELLDFVEETGFERLGVFMYSREEGTRAYSFKRQVHFKTKERRYKEIMNLQKGISLKHNIGFIRERQDVLIDRKEEDYFLGRSQFSTYDIDGVVCVKKKDLTPGEFYKVKITDAYEYDLLGQ